MAFFSANGLLASWYKGHAPLAIGTQLTLSGIAHYLVTHEKIFGGTTPKTVTPEWKAECIRNMGGYTTDPLVLCAHCCCC